MSAEIITLHSPAAVDEAWRALHEHRAPLIGKPRLLLDREWVQEEARLYARFARLFLAVEDQHCVIPFRGSIS